MKDKDKDTNVHIPVVLARAETTTLDTTKPFDQIAFRPRQRTQTASLWDVFGAKFARMVEDDTTLQLDKIDKQSASILSITENYTAAYKLRVETAVFVEQQMAEWLEAHHRCERTREQMRFDETLRPQQLDLQQKRLRRALIDADAQLDAANIRRGNVADAEAYRYRLERDLDNRRASRVNEAEDADHKLYIAESGAKRRMHAPAPAAPPAAPPPDDRPPAGDLQEAANVAEDVADGYVVTDAAHLYHAFAALAWISCMERGLDREQSLKEVAAKVYDRQQRHPLTERDARAYEARYLEAKEEFVAGQAAQAKREAKNAKAREQEQEREMRRFEVRAHQQTELGKAALERDAAEARERTAKVFMPDDGYDSKDDDDVVA
jgi:hypothetical protein